MNGPFTFALVGAGACIYVGLYAPEALIPIVIITVLAAVIGAIKAT